MKRSVEVLGWVLTVTGLVLSIIERDWALALAWVIIGMQDFRCHQLEKGDK